MPTPSFRIVQDTREQTPWRFDTYVDPYGKKHPEIPSVVRKLDQGDYAVEGLEHVACLERKTLSDFIGSLTFGRRRFEDEMERLVGYERAAIVVEAEFTDVFEGLYRSAAKPVSLIGSVAAIDVRWGVVTHFVGNRGNAIYFARTWLSKVATRLGHLRRETAA